MAKRRLIVGITGATGSAYGVRLLEELRALKGWEAHLVLTDAGVLNAHQELGLKRKDIERLAHQAYHPKDIGAAIASGSFLTEGMIVAPCSMKTLAAIAHAHADDLVSRAADVVLKERRRLVLVPRETPLSEIHLNCSLTSCAVWKRSSGSFARQVFTTCSSAGGVMGCTRLMGSGSFSRMARSPSR